MIFKEFIIKSNMKKKLIGICIDIRKSTKMVEKFGLKETTIKIKNFIEEIYRKLQKRQSLYKRARHQGDGILFTLPTEDDEKAFDKVKDFLIDILPIIKEAKKQGMDVGIGLDYGDSIEEKIENSPHSDKSLIVGHSISTSVKICSQVPFLHSNGNTYFIKGSREFLNNSNWDEDEIKWNAKKTMGFVELI